MSNRNNKSKSPQLKKNVDKDLVKYLILQKITKPNPPQELQTKTQPDEDSEVEDFKQEIEIKYKNCKINHSFKFPREIIESSSDSSLQSLQDVTVYNLNCDNIDRLTDATQPQFMKALNERLIKLTDLIEDETTKQKQYNYAPNLKSSRLQKVRGQNLSSTSITKPIDQSSQGRDSVTNKPHSNLCFRATPSLSSEKKNQSKQIQQILKIAQQKQLNNNRQYFQNISSNTFYKRTPQVNNNYVNIHTNINHSMTVGTKKNIENIRIKTEYDEQDNSLNNFHVIPKSRPKVRESTMKSKKLEISQGHKILNYTVDSHILEQLGVTRNAKSQNKNYKI